MDDISLSGIGELLSTPIAKVIGGVAGGVAVGSLVTASIIGAKRKSSYKSKRSKSGHRITHTRRGWKQDRARRSKQKWEVAYQRRKKRKGKRVGKIYYTKKGQPYKILSSGKARFVKK